MTLPESMWRDITDYRFAERIATESEAVRRLLASGLRAEEKAKKWQSK